MTHQFLRHSSKNVNKWCDIDISNVSAVLSLPNLQTLPKESSISGLPDMNVPPGVIRIKKILEVPLRKQLSFAGLHLI